MAAYNYQTYVDASVEVNNEPLQRKGRHEVYPNFNGVSSVRPFSAQNNYQHTGDTGHPAGMLWTALYGLAGPNTITIQFPAPLLTVSTTTGDYTLSGPSAPSISSVTYGSGSSLSTGVGSRNVVLNLSGPLVATNTYTLSIANGKIHSGGMTLDSTISPYRVGVYNWPDYTVDVIMPAQIDCIGVGIAQTIDLGDPGVNIAGENVGVGFEQEIALGDPLIETLLETTGVGIDQTVTLGTPVSTAGAQNVMVGIAQAQGIGTPVITRQEMPVGVGINQTIDVGTPVSTIDPITVTGQGINQLIGVGTPLAGILAGVVGVGIDQQIVVGPSPTASKDNTQFPNGVGIAQVIDVGQDPLCELNPIVTTGVGINQTINVGTSPTVTGPRDFKMTGVSQIIGVGTPTVAINPITTDSVGINQTIDVGTPTIATLSAYGEGIEQTIDLGTPTMETSREVFGVGISQTIAVGSPTYNAQTSTIGVGVAQLIDLGTPVTLLQAAAAHGVGVEQTIDVGVPRSMVPLTISVRQHNALIDLDAALQKAYADGVDGDPTVDLMLPIGDIPNSYDYRDQFTPLQQHQTKVPFENLACAAWVTLNIPGAWETTQDSDTVNLAKLSPTGITDVMTFVDGRLVTTTIVRNIECIAVGIAQSVSVGSPAMSHT